MARLGKIARLPHGLREELNRRIRDGAEGRRLIAWLNGLPEVQAVVTEFYGGAAITDQNFSDWRLNGYEQWRKEHDRIEHIRDLARYSMELAAASGQSLAGGAQAILAGQYMELLESTDGRMAPEEAVKMAGVLAGLRASELASERLKLEVEKVKQKERELGMAEQKFYREHCRLFWVWRDDERVKALEASGLSNAEKIERLGQLMFGEIWKREQPEENAGGNLTAKNAENAKEEGETQGPGYAVRVA